MEEGVDVNFVKIKHVATPIIVDVGESMLMETDPASIAYKGVGFLYITLHVLAVHTAQLSAGLSRYVFLVGSGVTSMALDKGQRGPHSRPFWGDHVPNDL